MYHRHHFAYTHFIDNKPRRKPTQQQMFCTVFDRVNCIEVCAEIVVDNRFVWLNVQWIFGIHQVVNGHDAHWHAPSFNFRSLSPDEMVKFLCFIYFINIRLSANNIYVINFTCFSFVSERNLWLRKGLWWQKRFSLSKVCRKKLANGNVTCLCFTFHFPSFEIYFRWLRYLRMTEEVIEENEHSYKLFLSIDFGCTQVRSVLMMCVILQWTTADSVKWLIFNWKFNSPVTDYTSFKRRIVQFELEKKTSWSWNGMVEWTKWINAIWLWIKSIY